MVAREQRYDLDIEPGTKKKFKNFQKKIFKKKFKKIFKKSSKNFNCKNIFPAERPDTSVVVARRLIAANLDGKIARQIRAAEEEEKLIKVSFGTFFDRSLWSEKKQKQRTILKTRCKIFSCNKYYESQNL